MSDIFDTQYPSALILSMQQTTTNWVTRTEIAWTISDDGLVFEYIIVLFDADQNMPVFPISERFLSPLQHEEDKLDDSVHASYNCDPLSISVSVYPKLYYNWRWQPDIQIRTQYWK